MEKVIEHIDREITQYMEREHVSQTEMASNLKVTTNTLSAKRRGDSEWKWSELQRMCELFHMTPNQLTGIN